MPSPARRAARQLPIPLGQILLKKGLVNKDGLDRALDLKRRTGVKFGNALIELGLLSETGLAEALRWQGRLACVTLSPKIIDTKVARQLPEDIAHRLGAVVVNRIGGTVTVALDDPADLFVIDELQRLLGARIFAVHAEPARIRECQHAVYNAPTNSMSVGANSGARIVLQRRVEPEPAAPAWDVAKQVPDLMRAVLEAALAADATSVHFEPRAAGLAVRLRLRQGLRERELLPAEWGSKSIGWLRELAGLPSGPSNACVEGRGLIELAGNEHLAQVSIAPGQHGESATVRLRPRAVARIALDSIDLDPEQRAALAALIAAREGLILSLGPVGSGVTTALHAMVRQLVRADRKIVALEDPLEVVYDGVLQVDAARFRGRSQASALRALLRHDPDVLMLGELCDRSAWEIVEHAAASGVLVLAGLRAPSVGGAMEALWRMGAGRFGLTQVLRGLVVQRAFGTVCPSCATNRPLEPRHVAELARLGLGVEGLALRRGRGCDACHARGVRGALYLREVHTFDTGMAEASLHWHSAADVDAQLAAAGRTQMVARALAAAQSGALGVDELLHGLTRG